MSSEITFNSNNTEKFIEKNQDDSLIDTNNSENENNLLLNTSHNNKQEKSEKNEVFSTFKGDISNIVEDRIICFSRRRKCPKKCNELTGAITTFVFFIFFSLLMTMSLLFSKNRNDLSNSIKSFYNYIIIVIWTTSIISIIFLIDAASSDPGRQRGTPIKRSKFSQSKIRKIVGGKKYLLKYCTTCHLIRDIRTFHCDTCGICIEKHDHHCNYLSNCVGVYNYRKFFIFLVSACIHVNIIFFTILHYIFFCRGQFEWPYEWLVILMSFLLFFASFFEIFTVWMVVQHIITIIENRTTREFIKKKEYGIYNKGCKENCKEALCSNTIKEL